MRLRNIDEVARYLDACRSNMGINLFCFDPWLQVRDVHVSVDAVKVEDVTNGRELSKISAINTVDDDLPPPIDYLTELSPQGDAHIPRDTGFLVRCTCTDNCTDKKRCACAQLTVKATALDAEERFVDNTAGYVHRRLKAGYIYFLPES